MTAGGAQGDYVRAARRAALLVRLQRRRVVAARLRQIIARRRV